MKKIVLALGVLATVTGFAQNAQKSIKDPSIKRFQPIHEGVPQRGNLLQAVPSKSSSASSSAGRAVNAVQIGVSGNLLTVTNADTKPLYADDSIGSVVFVHRGINLGDGYKNKGQYIFDVSQDKGSNWDINLGPLNPSAPYVGTPSGRFPQAVLFRPNNSLIADSAYLAYSGTWLDYSAQGGNNEEWDGEFRGLGRIDGDSTTYTESADQVYGGFVAVAQGMKQSANGVFWNLQLTYRINPNGNGGSDFLSDSIIIMKGVWNATTRDIDWTEHAYIAHGAVVEVASNGVDANNLLTDFDIAFDPTGQIGWLAVKGDFILDNQYTFDVGFFKSTDGGNTWTARTDINLTQIQEIAFNLNYDVSGLATTSGTSDLIVDVNGNPHYLLGVLNGAEDDGSGQNKYNIYPNAGAALYDLTYDPNAGNGCNWKAYLVDTLFSILAGDVCLEEQGGGAITLDLSASLSMSADGKKIFYSWLDTREISGLNPNPADNFLWNISPNLYVRGLDVVTKKFTTVKNITENDPLFGGDGVGTAGNYGGALFPKVSPTVFTNGSTYQIPATVTEIDYLNTSGFNRYAIEPCRFSYIKDISFADADFTDSIVDLLPPVITLNDSDIITLLVGTPYTEYGATAVDCEDGQVQVTFSNNVDVNTPGEYTAVYIAEDAAGNKDTVTRTIIVGRVPEASFSYTFQPLPNNGTRVNFADKSLFAPVTFAWSFPGGTPGSSSSKNPFTVYYTSGQKCVTLTASNSFGSDDTTICLEVTVGVDEIVFNESLNVYPNPSTGKVYVSVAGLDNEEMTVSVINMLGETVLPVAKKLVVSGEGLLEIDATSLQAGSYFVKIEAARAAAVRPVTIVK